MEFFLKTLFPGTAAVLSTMVGYRLSPIFPAVSVYFWVLIWAGSAVVYSRLRSDQEWAKASLLGFAFLGGVILEISPAGVVLARSWLLLGWWMLFAVGLLSVNLPKQEAIMRSVGLISVGYAVGWIYLILKDGSGILWLIWTLFGGALFAFLIAGEVRGSFQRADSNTFPLAGDLYLLLFNLFLICNFSAYFWLKLNG